jgi:hypothetical protein
LGPPLVGAPDCPNCAAQANVADDVCVVEKAAVRYRKCNIRCLKMPFRDARQNRATG